jgi:hypothetical protein
METVMTVRAAQPLRIVLSMPGAPAPVLRSR